MNWLRKILGRPKPIKGAVRGRLYEQEGGGNVTATRGQTAKVVGIKLIREDGSIKIIKEPK